MTAGDPIKRDKKILTAGHLPFGYLLSAVGLWTGFELLNFERQTEGSQQLRWWLAISVASRSLSRTPHITQCHSCQ
jgi:hypothetical protein